MLKISELKEGDVVRVEEEDMSRQGRVVDISQEDLQAFWYDLDKIHPLPLDDQQLTRLGFAKETNGQGVKYMKGPFRIVVENNNFSDIEMWYREDHRHFNIPIGVHHLQNVYLQMTKVPLQMPE
jgi:hypothetical protein